MKEMKSLLSWDMESKQVMNKVISNEVSVVETMEQGMFMPVCHQASEIPALSLVENKIK